MDWALETAEMIAANSPSAVQAVKRQISATIADHALTPRGAGAGAGRCGARQPAFRRGHRRVPREAPATVLMTTTRPQSRTLGDLVDELAAATPQAPSRWSAAPSVSISPALKARIDAFARALLALGIGRGDRVALLCSNRTEWVVAALAAAKLGAPVAAISTFSTPRELACALEHSGARALIMLSRSAAATSCRRCASSARSWHAVRPGALQSARAAGLAHRRRAGRRCAARHLRPGGVPGARRRRRRRGAGAGAGGGHAGRHLLHPLHLGLHRRAQGRDPGARAIASPTASTSASASISPPTDRLWLAVPLFWSFGSANALPAIMTHGGCDGAAGELRAGRGAGADRARALQRVLRHGQHGARPAGASRSSRAPAGRDAHRPHHRSAGGHHAHHPGAGRRRALQRLRLDRDLRQLRRHRRSRPAAAAPCHARACRCRA